MMDFDAGSYESHTKEVGRNYNAAGKRINIKSKKIRGSVAL